MKLAFTAFHYSQFALSSYVTLLLLLLHYNFCEISIQDLYYYDYVNTNYRWWDLRYIKVIFSSQEELLNVLLTFLIWFYLYLFLI